MSDNWLETPLLSALQSVSAQEHSSFYAPGHKRGKGINPNLVNLLGADLTVQSTHKVLGAMTQASMLHLQGTRISDRYEKFMKHKKCLC
ncbi:MAG: hypothetical protein ACFCU5_03645 [Pleurocapsa sp.]